MVIRVHHHQYRLSAIFLLATAIASSNLFGLNVEVCKAEGASGGVDVVNAAAAAAPVIFSMENRTTPITTEDDEDYGGEQNRIGRACSKDDIAIYQGPSAPLPNGIPAFSVQILNVGVSGCCITNIHVRCGWFSSYRVINPTVFRRLNYDDCLVNNGQPLAPSSSLYFVYANSFSYPLSVSSVSSC